MTRPKLLLADDSVTIRKVVELTFADEGIDVTTASDAESAMQEFVEIQPDIVLVDVGMTGTSGYQICEMIKLDEATKHIPVLLLVGSFEPFDQDEAERVGADGFLTKPFHSIRDLVARVSDLLGREAVAEVPQAPKVPAETSDIDNLYEKSFADTAEIAEFETVDDMLGDSGMDDEMIEASYPAGSGSDNVAEFAAAIDNGETIKAFDWSPESVVTEPDTAETPAAVGFEPKFVIEDDEETATESAPAISEVPPTDNIPVATDHNDSKEPSAEFISLVAQRVVEKLSDRVIREIAQDAVPRIAEKLIREALEEDKKQ